MRLCRRLFISVFAFFVLLLPGSGNALAQDGNCTYPVSIPVIRGILLNVTQRVDNKLGTWVSGDTLTEPEGEDFVADLAGLIADIVSYVAECIKDVLIWLDFV
jgi:hypothetical protein